MSVTTVGGQTPVDLALGTGTTLIEASAGTGKTHALMTLVLRLIAEKGWGIDQILIVTFTRAATEELRDRIRRALRTTLAAMKMGDAGDDRQAQALLARWEAMAGIDAVDITRRLEAATHAMDWAHVYTIHGFCQRVLIDFAFESGFPFTFEVGGDDSERVAGAVRDFWRRTLYPASPQLVGHAIETGFLPSTLASWVSARRSQLGVEIVGGEAVDPTVLAACEASWRSRFETTRTAWIQHRGAFRAALLKGDWLNRNRYRARQTEQDLDQIEAGFDAPEPRLPEQGAFGRYGRTCLTDACKKGKKLPENPLFDAFDRLEDASLQLRVTLDRRLRHARRELLQAVHEEVRRGIRADRRLSYDDLLIELDEALRGTDGTRLAARIRTAYPCALFDEYQDTDPIQARIFERIYGAARAEDRSELRSQDVSRIVVTGGTPIATAARREIEAGGGGPVRAGMRFVVGDPKQSIYRFRGADVFAFLAARDAADTHITLNRNWRSIPPLVAAVNAVFAASTPFMVPEIEYQPVAPAQSDRDPLRIAPDPRDPPDPPDPPFRFRLIPPAEDGGLRTKEATQSLAVDTTADEIARLLACAADGRAAIDQAPLTGADIAVLVRTRDQGRRIAEALRVRGVRSVEIDDASVYETREAEQLDRLLWALVEPAREARVRGALAGDLFGFDARALFALREDETAWSTWRERIAHWSADWAARGIGPVLLRLLEETSGEAGGHQSGAEHLLRHRDGVRRLTNYRHLAERLQEVQTQRRFAPAELAAWLSRRRAQPGPADDSVQLRLESDEQLVRILTVHGSKGLEFPIVFCPFAWHVRAPKKGADSAGVTYHRGAAAGYREVLQLDPDASALAATRVEAAAEELRLLYVALTRAQYRCVVTWGQVKGAEYAPLTWLLHRAVDAPAPGATDDSGDGSGMTPSAPAPASATASATATAPATASASATASATATVTALEAAAERFKTLSAAAWREQIEACAQRAPNAISVTLLPDPEPSRAPAPREDAPAPPPLVAREFTRTLRRTRQSTSFTALSSARPAEPQPAIDEVDAGDDRDRHRQPLAATATTATTIEAHDRTAFTFPRGRIPGLCLHQIFRYLDESPRIGSDIRDLDAICPDLDAICPDLDAICHESLRDFGIDAQWSPIARAMVERTRALRLEASAPGRDQSSGAGGFRLGDPIRRCPELEFCFPVPRLDRQRLAARLIEYGYPDPFPPPRGRERGRPSASIDGFMRGFIDLVIEHESRWYIIDYKSNWLGSTPGDYAPAALTEEMRARRYPLQYLIYLTALHRYLAVRLPGYDYQRHVGGVFYLFVRAIDPAAGTHSGVYFDRPSPACLYALDDCFRGGGA